jgi:DNA helicase-2/ATP-dependent DNA helicase PcrA
MLRRRINYEAELNEEQLKVVKESNGPCLVLAGAGTGKTRTIVYRVAYLLENGARPENILLLTFTNKAAQEMLRRVEILVGIQPKGFLGGTFHHVGNLILRKYGKTLGYSPDYTILDEEDSHNLFSQIITEMGLKKKNSKNYLPKPALLAEILSLSINSQKNLLEIIEKRFPSFREQTDNIQQIATIYEERKREKKLVDFDDLLFLWYRLLKERPEIKEVLLNRFHFILIDEYQDTNRLQGMIVEELASGHQNLLAVGDDAQSIYGFRGATVENILNFPKVFPNTKIFKLRRNYRSTQAILDLANFTIQNNWHQFEKKLESNYKKGEKPELWVFPDSEEEARFIVDQIMDFREEGETFLDSAVLFRSVYQAIEIELELQKRGIPYVLRGGIRFFEQVHIKDIIAYLKVLLNQHDDLAWQRILKLEEGIGEKNALKISQILTQLNFDYSRLDSKQLIKEQLFFLSSIAQLGIENVFRRLKHLSEYQTNSISQMILYLLDDFYEKYLTFAFEDAKDRLEDLKQLAYFAQRYKNLPDFLSDATLSEGFRKEKMDLSKEDENREYLILSTIHQAKGLEWKNVFLIGLVDGQFPHYKSLNRQIELEEERRLFYVACTRAKERLFLTYPLSSSLSFYRPSVFIRELKPELLKINVETEKIIDFDDGK